MNHPEPVFGTLDDVAVRDAWRHEAHRLTPWLAANLDRIAEVIGIPLELEDTEVRVESFAADIIARDPTSDRRVLIENQLEVSDHTHLGQVMTYLAGLEVNVVVWIAPDFREPHLSAIRWLNQHTVEPFAFFAIRLRVVRIGSSPLAPLFDVVERPNDWDRRLQEKVRATAAPSELGQKRLAFWQHMNARFPDAGHTAGATAWRTVPVDPFGLVIVQYIAKEAVGVFVRPPHRGDSAELLELLFPVRAELEARLGVALDETGDRFLFQSKLQIDTDDQGNWDRMADWLKAETDRYIVVLKEALSGSSQSTPRSIA